MANEAGARLTLKEKGSFFSIVLSANLLKPISATFDARIVAPDDKMLARASIPVQLSSTPRRFEVPLNWIPVNGLEDACSSRLFYEVRLEGSSTPAISGTLSPYALIPDLFELHFLGLDAIGMGRTYAARVWATRPDSDRPVPGITLIGSLGDEDDDTAKGMKAQARTDSRGEALLTFRLPEMPGAPDDEQVEMEIGGARGNFQNSLTANLHYWRRAAVLLSTDKPCISLIRSCTCVPSFSMTNATPGPSVLCASSFTIPTTPSPSQLTRKPPGLSPVQGQSVDVARAVVAKQKGNIIGVQSKPESRSPREISAGQIRDPFLLTVRN